MMGKESRHAAADFFHLSWFCFVRICWKKWVVNLIIVLTDWWLLNTEMCVRQSQNTSPVKADRIPASHLK